MCIVYTLLLRDTLICLLENVITIIFEIELSLTEVMLRYQDLNNKTIFLFLRSNT
jgi:hypothetical protein